MKMNGCNKKIETRQYEHWELILLTMKILSERMREREEEKVIKRQSIGFLGCESVRFTRVLSWDTFCYIKEREGWICTVYSLSFDLFWLIVVQHREREITLYLGSAKIEKFFIEKKLVFLFHKSNQVANSQTFSLILSLQ